MTQSKKALFREFRGDLDDALAHVESICRRYGYQAKPTLVLRHHDGNQYSAMFGNDSPQEVIDCIQYLRSDGTTDPMTSEVQQHG